MLGCLRLLGHQVRFEVDNAEQIVGLEAGCRATWVLVVQIAIPCGGQVEFGRIVGIQSALIPAVRSSDQDVKLILSLESSVRHSPCSEYGMKLLNIIQQRGNLLILLDSYVICDFSETSLCAMHTYIICHVGFPM